jgi:hypothetical protein
MVDTTYKGGTLQPGIATYTPAHGDVVWRMDGTGVQFVRGYMEDGTEVLSAVLIVRPQERP